MTKIGIYQIQSKIKPERIYIGSSVDINYRWRTHKLDLKRNKHHSIKLQRHYNKYGKEDLTFSILLECDRDNLISIEQFYLDSYNTYFNLCKVAGNCTGRICSEETKKKISKSASKRRGQIPWNKGKKHTEEVKLKISKTLTGKKRGPTSLEVKKKISESRKGIPPWNKKIA